MHKQHCVSHPQGLEYCGARTAARRCCQAEPAPVINSSRAGTHQIRDQSHALKDRNDSNNSLEVYTPNSFIHLFYNSPYMDIVDMHNILITPSDSVLWVKTVEASYLVGSFPCQLSQISLTDILVWDEVWEQATFWHLCTLWKAAHSDSSVSTGYSGKNPSFKDSSSSPLPVTTDRCEK